MPRPKKDVNKIETTQDSDDNVRLSNHKIFLTYKTHLHKKDYHNWLNEKYPVHKIAIVHETGKTGYEHTHVLVDFVHKITTRSKTIFDYKNIHPGIEKISSKEEWEKSFTYISKQDKNIYKTFDTNQKNFIERCWEHKTVTDAVQSEAKSLGDVSAIKILYEMKPLRFNLVDDDLKDITLDFPWQLKLLDILSNTPTRTDIYWFYSNVGGVGKTTCTEKLIADNPEDYYKVTDILDDRDFPSTVYSALCAGWRQKVFLFDLPRITALSKHLYKNIENLKTGSMTIKKYNSRTIRFDIHHVIVFANKPPKSDSISLNRWNIFEILPDKNYKVIDPYELSNTQAMVSKELFEE